MKGLTQWWKKSSYCPYGDCVEVRSLATEVFGDMVEIRSSVRPTVVIRITIDEWHAFMDGIRDGEFGV